MAPSRFSFYPSNWTKLLASPFLAMNTLSSFSSLLFFYFSIVSSHADSDHLPLPRPLILQHPTAEAHAGADDDAQLRCAAWRFAAEANNLSPWKTIPPECGGYVKEYMLGKGYGFDLEMVAREAGRYARSVDLVGDGMEAWVFDVDDTLLSNLPYYVDHGFG